jgi:hypothetical protein
MEPNFDPTELESLTREELILRARARGVERPEQMTRIELRDEIVRQSEPDLERQRRTRGWLGVARDLLASVVESGLNLPDAAAAIRGDAKALHEFQGPPPVATVTLAEIYAAQGHYEQALQMLEEVLEREPEHASAKSIRDRIAEERDLGPGRRRKVVETRAEAVLTPQPPPVAPRPTTEAAEPPATAPAAPAAHAAAKSSPFAEPPLAEPSSPFAAPPSRRSSPFAAPPPSRVGSSPFAAGSSPRAASSPFASPAPLAGQVAEEALSEAEVLPQAPPAPSSPAVLVLRTDDRAFIYWRLPEVAIGMRLRSVTVSPSSEGPSIKEADFVLPLPVGGFWLPELPPGTEIRAALGELSEHSFSPFAVAPVLESDAASFEPPGFGHEPELELAARAAAGL